MADINPGPAITSTANSLNVLTPVNNGGSGGSPNAIPQGSNALRLIASWRGMSVNATGDISIGVINTASFVPTIVVTTNGLVNGVSGTVAAASVGIYTAAAAGGTAVLTAAVLTGQTTSTFAYVRAATDVTTALSVTTLYAHVATAVAGGTIDMFLYGYDLT